MAAPRYLAVTATGTGEVAAAQASGSPNAVVSTGADGLIAASLLGNAPAPATVTTGGAGNAGRIPALNGSGVFDASMLVNAPAGLLSLQLAATEAVAQGALCNIFSASGTESVQNADGSAAGTKPCNGYAPAAIAQGATGTVVVSKSVITGLSGLTPGPAFLSETAKGGVQAAGSTTAGHTFQKVGEALSANTLLFDPQQSIVRA